MLFLFIKKKKLCFVTIVKLPGMQQEKFDQLWSKCDFTEQALKGLVNCAFESREHWISCAH